MDAAEFTQMKVDIAVLKEKSVQQSSDISDIKKGIESIGEGLTKHSEKNDNQFLQMMNKNSADIANLAIEFNERHNKYTSEVDAKLELKASKWTEKAIIGVITATMAAVGTAITKLIFK